MKTPIQMILETLEDDENGNINMSFFKVSINEKMAEENRQELENFWKNHLKPKLSEQGCNLEKEISYINLGAVMGDQGVALMLMALGEYYEWWTILTPEKMGFEGETARELAGHGLITLTDIKI
jgi:hypothetical protein